MYRCARRALPSCAGRILPPKRSLLLPCPGGESKAEVCQRVCTAFAALVDAALAAGEPQLVIVAHGGTQMAALERFAVPHKNYYSWCAPAAGGFVLDAADWVHQKNLRVVKTVQYTKELPC